MGSTSIMSLYEGEALPRETYIRSRIEDQIRYYEEKSIRNKRAYYAISVVSIIANALIPILSIFLKTPDTALKVAITCLSSFTAILSSCLLIFNCKNLWTKYRYNANMLTSLLHQYCARTGLFAGLEDERAFGLLAQRSEEYLEGESEEWKDLFSRTSVPSGER